MTGSSHPVSARLIGVDVATQPKSVGIALATLRGDAVSLERVARGVVWEALDEQLRHWLDAPALLALDAPLGWPAPLSDALHAHQAGAALPEVANALFRRRTDDTVAEVIGKRPLDVGADRIARTAHTALALLDRLRTATAAPIPLAWQPGDVAGLSAIEVYPAGTLAGRALPCSGYKGASAQATDVRQRILDGLRTELRFDTGLESAMCGSDHLLDAALCCLAAADFARAGVVEPDDPELARREGWIWVASGAE